MLAHSLIAFVFRTYDTNMFKVVNFVLHHYKNNEDLQILFRVYANEIMKFLHKLCVDDPKVTLHKLNTINGKAEEMKVHRLKLLAVLEKASDPFNKVSMEQIVWYVNSQILKHLI